ncbi:MAG TPA: hypothetical protein VGL53_25145 [Bryobacteraceae bacterium]
MLEVKGPVGDTEAARAELAVVVASSTFSRCPRMSRLLTYLCSKYFAGEADQIKEYNIAVDLLGRSVDFDPADNASARVEVHRLRKKLRTYYDSEGADRELRIEIPAGTYVPQFVPKPSALLPPAEPSPVGTAVLDADHPMVVELPRGVPVAATSKVAAPRGSRALWYAAAAVVAVAMAAFAVMQLTRKPNPEFETFWKPVLDSTASTMVVLPHPIVYHPTTRANHLNSQLHGVPPLPTQVPLDVPPNLLNGADFVPVFDQYVGFGDTVAVASLTTLFARRGGSVTVRLASKTEFADMRDSPAILIGAFTNRWAIEMTQKFRYHFFMDGGHKPAIADSQTNSRWLTDKEDNGHSNEDYLLICRLPKAQTGGFAIIAAGLTQYGTEEAGRILAHPQALAPILRQLPKGWESKNVELVLRSQIVGDTPTAPDLTAFYVW